MAVALGQSDIINVDLRIPKIDFKRMKGIAKAMGWVVCQTHAASEEEVKKAQETYVKETLTRALTEVKEMKALGKTLPDAKHLFDSLED